MTEPLNTSFIPKRNPNTPTRRTSTRRVFIGTLLIQIFFFSVLLACLGVFVYEKKLNHDRETQIASLNDAIKSFNEEKMREVVSVDNRINQVKDRLNNTVSISAILTALEASTVESVQIESLKLNREDDSTISMEAEMKTDSFDSIMFQRGVLERDEKLTVTNISQLKISNPQAKVFESDKISKKTNEKESGEFSVKFKADLAINSASVPHTVVTATAQNSVVNMQNSETNASEVSDLSQDSVINTDLEARSVVNQENI